MKNQEITNKQEIELSTFKKVIKIIMYSPLILVIRRIIVAFYRRIRITMIVRKMFGHSSILVMIVN